ncbi:hypothetical protein H0H92_015060 [Tricholoma furcatifolium]|nr:hypothetical protein H0H92_015060 [Tricholoma furcatifolium]
MAPSTAKGKDKALGEPKRSTRLTRQTSAALDLENAAMESAAYDDAVDYGYSDAPDPVFVESGVRISVVPASSSAAVGENSSGPATGSTLDVPDDDYLSPDTEDAMAANALAGNETDIENALNTYEADDDPVALAEGVAIDLEAEDVVLRDAGSLGIPTTPGAHTGRRSVRTPAVSDRPPKRIRERTQQSPWNGPVGTDVPANSVFPLNRAQLMAERTSASVGQQANTHIPTSGSLANVLLPHAATGASPMLPSSGASFTLTQEQLLTIIAAAQNGSLANLVNPTPPTSSGVPGTSFGPDTETSSRLHLPTGSLLHEQGTANALPRHTAHTTQNTHGTAFSVTLPGNCGLAPPTGGPRRPFLGRPPTEPAPRPAPLFPGMATATLGTPFAADSTGAGLAIDPAAGASGFTPLVCRLANPSTSALHALSPAQSIVLSADDRITPYKVQRILRSGFKEHVPLHHLTNKLMEEAAFSTPSSSGGIQISGQTISLGSVGLDKTGERNLTPECWIECSMNLVRSLAEHLLAGTDGRCGGPTVFLYDKF